MSEESGYGQWRAEKRPPLAEEIAKLHYQWYMYAQNGRTNSEARLRRLINVPLSIAKQRKVMGMACQLPKEKLGKKVYYP